MLTQGRLEMSKAIHAAHPACERFAKLLAFRDPRIEWAYVTDEDGQVTACFSDPGTSDGFTLEPHGALGWVIREIVCCEDCGVLSFAETPAEAVRMAHAIVERAARKALDEVALAE